MDVALQSIVFGLILQKDVCNEKQVAEKVVLVLNVVLEGSYSLAGSEICARVVANKAGILHDIVSKRLVFAQLGERVDHDAENDVE